MTDTQFHQLMTLANTVLTAVMGYLYFKLNSQQKTAALGARRSRIQARRTAKEVKGVKSDIASNTTVLAETKDLAQTAVTQANGNLDRALKERDEAQANVKYLLSLLPPGTVPPDHPAIGGS